MTDNRTTEPMLCPMKRERCTQECAWALRVIVPTYPKDETFMACAVAVIANGANCEYGIPVRKVDNAD